MGPFFWVVGLGNGIVLEEASEVFAERKRKMQLEQMGRKKNCESMEKGNEFQTGTQVGCGLF